MLKTALRQLIRNRKRQFTPQQLRELSLPVITRLQPLLSQAHTVMAYWSLPDEVDTHDLLDQLVAKGMTVVLPRVTSETTMELRRYTGADSLMPGTFGIMEPTGELFSDYAAIDTAIIPGIAFDNDGHRLGRGKGYYDRLLPLLTAARRVGICFPFQLIEHVSTESHDIIMDEIVC